MTEYSNSITGLIPCVVKVEPFSDVCMGNSILFRGGVFLYSEDEKAKKVILGRDTASNKFTNMAGHINLLKGTLEEQIYKECDEETLGLIKLDSKRLTESPTAYSCMQMVIMYKITSEERKSLLEKFPALVKEAERPEISDLVEVSWEKFWEIIKTNQKSLAMFRPVSFTLEDAENRLRQLLEPS